MIKRLTAILICAAVVIVMAGCNKRVNEAEEVTNEPAVAEENTQVTEPAVTEENVPATEPAAAIENEQMTEPTEKAEETVPISEDETEKVTDEPTADQKNTQIPESDDKTEDAVSISEDEAYKTACDYWEYTPGKIAEETGFEMFIIGELTDDNEYYHYILQWYVEEDDGGHMSTLDHLYIDAHSGECYSKRP